MTTRTAPAPAGRTASAPGGEADVAPVAALLAEPTRARLLIALLDGRALPAGVLAREAGVSAQTASGQLARLLAGGLLTVEPSGRRRYYRLAGPDVAAAVEALARLAPTAPVTSLRAGTRAQALRQARTCYDHLAGRLGVAVTEALLAHGALVAADGTAGTARRPGDPLAAPLPDHPYTLGPKAEEVCAAFGVDLPAVQQARTRRPLLRFCVDWTEQRHHLAGRLGAAFTEALLAQGWLERARTHRALRLTESGAERLAALDALPPPGPDGTSS
ncbi:transcriptional regulator [Streptomyces sp. Ru73]|uniref:ArsR/SmtB family transcription factor n=1 Tax=Streptomyces sp. Ru73 TaxID=2080748 RepID=UPI000CDD24DA|nr:helix-turn-helix transcriptional regulator [Streptomyces sp. Ru73]POX40642.1 transcriptional regulator [Streptomyces sp. Ru73]